MSHIDEEECSFEAVALDCSFHTPKLSNLTPGESVLEKQIDISAKKDVDPLGTPNEGDNAETEESEENARLNDVDNKYVLLILAGLTGGSGEGYVVDLVNEANQQGALQSNSTLFSVLCSTIQ